MTPFNWSRGRSVAELRKPKSNATAARERLRRRYRPVRVRALFIGEAPPASGRFFYQADSGLYRAIRDSFANVFGTIRGDNFLDSFRALGCYLVDLCGKPVDRLGNAARRRARRRGEARLTETIRRFRPEIVVLVIRAISPNVRRAEERAKWSGRHIELSYPGRWYRHRVVFLRTLARFLRQTF